MELLPIIQLAIVIFTTVVLFIILFSYIIYKSKEKKQSSLYEVAKNNNYNNRQANLINFQKANYGQKLTAQANKEYSYVVPKESGDRASGSNSSKDVKERFNIINEKQTNYPIYEGSKINPSMYFHSNQNSAPTTPFYIAAQSRFERNTFQPRYRPKP